MSYETLQHLCLLILLLPLAAGVLTGIAGKQMGRIGAHTITTSSVFIAFLSALCVAKAMIVEHLPPLNHVLYTWGISGQFVFNIGFLIDALSAMMLVIVTFVSLVVHIYSIGYMRDDPGYQRFFAYIALFTFAMITLVMANNFLQLYFGWEAVGLVSYLLIGFWFKRTAAAKGSLKAFLVNRVGDFGFLLGIALTFNTFGSIDYATVFPLIAAQSTTQFTLLPGVSVSVITLMCLLLFVGAMGKSAQVPLHVWLPESMEGPTPISALIHAATMVTAGIYMVSRLSSLYEYSETALSVMLVIGATGALFLGILALVQQDIKRVIAYSTLSQLGYMVAGLGASAFNAAIFHLFTHACFKALLFLAAGSVIIALHHEQDMRRMGGLYRYMPITYLTFLIGTLSLTALPPFSGFFSKDAIIAAVEQAHISGAGYAYACVLIGVCVTALYSFRAFFLVFHTQPRMNVHQKNHLKESPGVMLFPLIILAIPSIGLGAWLADPLLYDTAGNWFAQTLFVLPQHITAIAPMSGFDRIAASVHEWPFWLALLGIVIASVSYQLYPAIPTWFAQRFARVYAVLVHHYGFDAFNQWFFVRGGRGLANYLFHTGDVKLIDDLCVNGSGRSIVWCSRVARRMQSGYLPYYALIMIIGLFLFLAWTWLHA